ncbi:hypothetical protein NDA18_002566 [Ustilago nuda]|nr:hypothetical protein NDA18_002566 [Ustilago nuda]
MADRPNKLAFLSMPAPPGYVAGLGRGASGFTTRADIGPARLPASTSSKPSDDAGSDEGNGEEESGRFDDPENETNLFAGTIYEKDDEEADRIWQSVDERMSQRRRKFREARQREEREKARSEKPKIGAQFADLKRGLSAVTQDEWARLTESGSVTGKKRKAAAKREARNTRSFAISDTVLVGNRDRNAVQSALTEDQMREGEGEGAMLTNRRHQKSTLFAGFGDQNHPKHAPGWIAAARVEEVAGKMSKARKIITQGCQHCPRSEDIWLEAARLNTKENAKVILARSIQHVSQSVNIWLKAVQLESDRQSQKRVLRKSLEYMPNSVQLWKELVNLEENAQDARILLSGAVSAVPLSIDLWLALARLSPAEQAKKVLNEARKTIPTSHEIWLAAARLLEQVEGDGGKVDKTLAAAVKALKKAGVELSRDQWLQEAERMEKQASPMVCSAIVKATVELDIEEQDRSAVWLEDAQSALQRGCVETSRSILAYTLNIFPHRPAIWTQAAMLEKQHGTPPKLEALLESAVSHCPKAEQLWLMYAGEKADAGDIGGARSVLIRAFDANIGSEKISLAAAKLESENGQLIAAGKLLERARVEVGSERVWMKSVVFERDHGSPQRAMELVQEAMTKFASFDKLYMIAGQLQPLLHPSDPTQAVRSAREHYSRGIKACRHSIPLYLLASRLEYQAGSTIRSRAILEKARLHNPTSEEIWYESIQLEHGTCSSSTQAFTLLSRALQILPTSGLLWTLAIAFEHGRGRRRKMADALRKTSDDSKVVCTVAQQFWLESKYTQARKWFQRSTQVDADNGDAWAMWYRFELEQGHQSSIMALKEQVQTANPRHGIVWQSVAKDPRNNGLRTVQVLEKVAHKMVPLK